jgi:hypothetical protein
VTAASASATPAEVRAVRPDRLTVWPTEDGKYGIDVRWEGRDCIRQAVVVRQFLVKAGFEAQPGNSQDGRIWELTIGPVPADDVGRIVSTYIR